MAAIRIWHQSFTDLTVMPVYHKTLSAHAATVMGDEAEVKIHGLRPGTYAEACAPIAAIRHRWVAAVQQLQVADAALVAQEEGFHAMAVGCFFDPGLREARSLVDIPVVSLGESCALTACSLGRRFGMVTLCADQSEDYSDMIAAYGLARRFAGAVALDPAIDEFALEADEDVARSIEDRFEKACAHIIARGADIIIPADGVLNEFLVRRGRLKAQGMVPVMDSLGVLFQHAAFMVKIARSTGAGVSRLQMYTKPSPQMVDHVRGVAGLRPLTHDFSGDR